MTILEFLQDWYDDFLEREITMGKKMQNITKAQDYPVFLNNYLSGSAFIYDIQPIIKILLLSRLDDRDFYESYFYLTYLFDAKKSEGFYLSFCQFDKMEYLDICLRQLCFKLDFKKALCYSNLKIDKEIVDLQKISYFLQSNKYGEIEDNFNPEIFTTENGWMLICDIEDMDHLLDEKFIHFEKYEKNKTTHYIAKQTLIGNNIQAKILFLSYYFEAESKNLKALLSYFNEMCFEYIKAYYSEDLK